ncbi:hypothetical protein [Vallitalea guaymasensis]|uniref:hypothetical protein n=1 Tax=Vallitalea guaymasensis TaxID=1185412 RepID=UPI001FA86A01|nr:hypothetical protein [Vallitalea guaymasensis]
MHNQSYIISPRGAMVSQIILHIITIIIYIGLFALSIYLLVLLIKLAKRGIKALDIYIDNNRKEYLDNNSNKI